QPLLDIFSWMGFRYQRWRWAPRAEGEGGAAWYVLAAAFAVLLAWRLATRRRVAVAKAGAAAAATATTRSDSPFQRVVSSLERRHPVSSPGETLGNWLARLYAGPGLAAERESLRAMLALHQRWRFDPLGLPPSERKRLADAVEDWLRHQGSA
ncbi:MAG TPA: DUF4129 domain-containing protein, partial [Burkholderiales bacterium]|nr:DUF4129 domain-containing protein [Burkholderiales bacterium]